MPKESVTPEKVVAAAPVRQLPGDPPLNQVIPGLALCLSGGGYRAMLFHTGALIRLNQLGYLPRLDRVSSVSGGSITAGVLGLNWAKLNFVNGVAQNFMELVIAPIRKLAGKTIDVEAVLGGLLLPGLSAIR